MTECGWKAKGTLLDMRELRLLVIVANWWGAAPFRQPRDLPQASRPTIPLHLYSDSASFPLRGSFND
jgi:hypothetical protein